jgi:hypothetical protein
VPVLLEVAVIYLHHDQAVRRKAKQLLMKAFTSFCMQGTVFAGIGFSAGITGTAVSNFLLLVRKALDPNFKVQVGVLSRKPLSSTSPFYCSRGPAF